MKSHQLFVCFLLSFLSVGAIQCQNSGKLFLDGDRLIGQCGNKVYTGFEIELDTIYQAIDSLKLLGQLPRNGLLHFRNKAWVSTEFELTQRAGYPQIIYRFRNDYITFDDLKFYDDHVTFTIDNDPDVPPTIDDLRIIKLAKSMLSEEKYWDSVDDRDCTKDVANKCYSIYCALRVASMTIDNKYNHRNASLQKLRHLLAEQYPNKKWNHRLMDFNNMKETSYADIIKILEEIEAHFAQIIEGHSPSFKSN